MNNYFPITLNYPGALTGDQDPYITLHKDMTLIGVSAQCITQDATIFVEDDGTQVTDTLTVTAGTTPVTQSDKGDFTGDQFPLFKKGSVLHVDIDNGSNCVDLVIVLTFAL